MYVYVHVYIYATSFACGGQVIVALQERSKGKDRCVRARACIHTHARTRARARTRGRFRALLPPAWRCALRRSVSGATASRGWTWDNHTVRMAAVCGCDAIMV